ncbi:thiamine diphosphokinase [Clostridium isatidis]|uniref:Thiamine diphosphokinase n=1 Tax=Clostridium isatidis TaxID=182773 RepID=A0A343JBQ5_9CLOT|nr:thiamine diphosphokinase [Clostridium isatidis]ASW42963.1 thiamine diphosphokinase [Clostridium isatidis]NLZ35116.1 thiamine diphosphokinase [Clostridiales bacterium]
MKALIVSGGNPPGYELLKEKSEDADIIIGVDRGCDILYKYKIEPDYILGDFDSADILTLNYFEKLGIEKIKLKREKDDTDSKVALDFAIDKGAKYIIFLGATGTRLDHTLSNLGLMLQGLEKGVLVVIEDEYNKVFLAKENIKIKGEKGQIVSFKAYSGLVKNLTIKGAKYELNNYNLKIEDGITTSNEFLDKNIELIFDSGILMILYSKD